MIKGNFEFEFLSPSRCVLGISYTKGVMHEQDGIDKDFHEILLGFIFFNISLLITKVKEGN
jgi:hypothetical protein